MPNLIVPPNTTNFNNELPNGTLSLPVISIPAFIFSGSSYPLPAITVLAQGLFALPASGTVSLLAVGATDRAFITHFSYKNSIALAFTLRLGTTTIFYSGNNLTTFVVAIPQSHPLTGGNNGDDLNLFNVGAAAANVELTVLGFVLTP